MVAKISMGTSLYGALAYNGLKVNEGEGRLLAVNRVFDDGSGRVDVARAERDFKRFMPEQVFANFLGSLFRRFLRHAEEGKNNQSQMSFELFLCLLQLYLVGCHIGAIQFFYAGNDSTGNLLFDNHIRLTIIRILFAREGTQKKDTICIVSFFYRE